MITKLEMRFIRRKLPRFLTALALVLFLGGGVRAQDKTQDKTPPALVMVSVDGMKPEYITHAEEHGAKVPNLRQMMQEGMYAEGVQGVVPTVTYPSHTTLVTGVWPAKHGIYANTLFDPLDKGKQAWYWYAEDLKVPALWDVAREAGRTTASVQWPVTVGAKITWDIPEVWRAGDENDLKLIRAVSTPGLLDEIKKDVGEEYRGGIDAAVEADEVRTRYAVWILIAKKPGVLLLHLLALDHIEHETGPFSLEAIATLERLDAAIGYLRSAAEHAFLARPVVFAVVSDHGFVKVEKQVNFGPAFVQAGLITLDKKEKITDWKAFPWATGGSAAIVLKDPKDEALKSQVRELLAKLASDPANGIDRVLEADDLHKRGGYPPASFFVGLKPGWKNGYAVTGPVTQSVKTSGTHGALNDLPELRSSFFVVGGLVPKNKNLGLIDMRDIAPTLAGLVGLKMPSADGKNLLAK